MQLKAIIETNIVAKFYLYSTTRSEVRQGQIRPSSYEITWEKSPCEIGLKHFDYLRDGYRITFSAQQLLEKTLKGIPGSL